MGDRRAFIVCCYGVYDRLVRTPEEMAGYDQYLEGVAGLILKHRPHYLYLCGGQKSLRNGKSEAETVSLELVNRYVRYYRDHTTKLWPELFLEEDSRSTAQNIAFAVGSLRDDVGKITIVCDTYRAPKCWALAWRFCRGYQWQVVGFPRPDPNPRSSWLVQIPQALAYLVLPKGKILGE